MARKKKNKKTNNQIKAGVQTVQESDPAPSASSQPSSAGRRGSQDESRAHSMVLRSSGRAEAPLLTPESPRPLSRASSIGPKERSTAHRSAFEEACPPSPAQSSITPSDSEDANMSPLQQIAAVSEALKSQCSPGEQLQAARSCTAADLPPVPTKSRPRRIKRRWLGALLAVLVAAALTQPYVRNEMLKRRLAFLPETGLPNMPAFLTSLAPPMGDVLPKFDFDFDLDLANQIYQMLPEMGENISVVGEQLSRWSGSLRRTLGRAYSATTELPMWRPGRELKEAGLTPKHPVLIIPGFVTSGLDLWSGKPCASHNLRQRVWGTWRMTYSFLLDKTCWLKHMALDEVTGLDPKGIKVRASKGLSAIEYFLPGFHVWHTMTEALADFGYDPDSMWVETYDWRLSLPNLQIRDKYFTQVKHRVELLHELHGEKVFVVSHSWGDTVFRCFMAWVSLEHPTWVEDHVAVYTNIAGPTLGVPKSVASFLSGETRDTVGMGQVINTMGEFHFTRAQRLELLRTWGGGMGMLPVGGDRVWGNATWAPDDTPELREVGKSYGAMLTMWEADSSHALFSKLYNVNLKDTFSFGPLAAGATSSEQAENNPSIVALDVEEAVETVLKANGPLFRENVEKWGAANLQPKRCQPDPAAPDFHFSPLDCPLPKAPSLRMFCTYGVGVPTERSYHYEHYRTREAFEVARDGASTDLDPSGTELDVPYKLSVDVNDPGSQHGIMTSDGDGTVPLVSLGGLCRGGWREGGSALNPSGIPVVTREYRNELSLFGNDTVHTRHFNWVNPLHHFEKLRRFKRVYPYSSDHVDILSHEHVLRDVLLMAAGHHDQLQDQIVSPIDDIVANISPPLSGTAG